MTTYRDRPKSEESRAALGFTLIELMIVVTIIGVLAVIAVVTYRNYVKRAKTNEAVTNLGAISAKQNAYFQEFLQYCDVAEPHPATMPTTIKVAWAPAAGSNWNVLGFRASGPVNFQYDVTAGPPGDPGMPGAVGLDPAQHWFLATAMADQDNDGTPSLFELTSNRTDVVGTDELE